VSFIEGVYLTLRPSFGDRSDIYAYRTEIAWDAASSSLVFRESERVDAEFAQAGRVAVPNQSGFDKPAATPLDRRGGVWEKAPSTGVGDERAGYSQR
jgi:hypothetical protein